MTLATPLILIGYFPRKVSRDVDHLRDAGVTAIRSASSCISQAPFDARFPDVAGAFWTLPTIAEAAATVPADEREQHEIHAYRMLPALFDNGMRRPFEMPPIEVEPLPAGYISAGFDAVSCVHYERQIECSPLSCNCMASEYEVNEHCLLPTLEAAEAAALWFSDARSGVEPGPYVVLEVLWWPA